MLETCPFNASEEYGSQISSPPLCSPRDNNACRAAYSHHNLHGAYACCHKTASRILRKGGLEVVSRALTEIQDSTPGADNPLQEEAKELKAKGIRNALSEAGYISTLPVE